MTDNEYKIDLEYLYSALQKHPLLISNEHKKKNFEKLYFDKIDKYFDYNSFVDTATELTTFFNDGHTNIEIPYTAEQRCLHLKCCWKESNNNDLILIENYDDILIGTKIIDIEGMTIDAIVCWISNRIPHENCFLVKSRMIMYPYLNYHIFSEMNMKLLFGERDYYTISFLVDGEIIKKDVPLTYYDGFLDFSDDKDFLSFEIQNRTAILHLNTCICNQEYITTLRNIAHNCKEMKISSFILDLSQNMGGSSAVIDEFIKFTNTEYFRRYEMLDYSSGEVKCVTSRHDLVKNMRADILLPNEIYCKVSYNTFSSAQTFAVTLNDNRIAKIIGSETGGKPNSYGMPQKLKMPISNIRFRVSRCYFLRPDISMDDALTLTPMTQLSN